MKIARLLTFGLLFAASLVCLQADTSSRTIRLRSDAWMPFCGNPTDAQPGYVVELARVIFAAKGYALDYQLMPWTDALKAAAAGEIDGVIGANREEAKQLVIALEPIGAPAVGLYLRKDNPWKFSDIGSLDSIRLGVSAGYSYWPELYAYIAKAPKVVSFEGATPLVDAIAKLDAGELDVVAESQPVWIWTIKKSGRVNKDYRNAFNRIGEPIYIAFSSKAPAECPKIFAEGLRELRANGKLAEILARYYQQDWKQ